MSNVVVQWFLRLWKLEEEKKTQKQKERRKMMKPVLERSSTLRRRDACPRANEVKPADTVDSLSLTEQETFSQDTIDSNLSKIYNEIFPKTDKRTDKRSVFTYLINLRAFVPPIEIFHKLFQDNNIQFFNNVFEFCEEWIDSIPYDFCHPNMRKKLNELLDLCNATKGIREQRRCDDLVDKIAIILNRLERYENAIENLKPCEEVSPNQYSTITGLMVISMDARMVAQQMTHIELERLSMIGADELAHVSKLEPQNFKKHLYGENSPKNIQRYIDWFNQLTALVATEVLRYARKKHRVKCIEFLVDVANECINIGNFNSLMAIVAGLSIPPVSRLRRTWTKVEKGKLDILQKQLDPSGNFLSYRATMKAAIWRAEGATNDSERIIIPFFGLQLKDLYLISRKCRVPVNNTEDFNLDMFNEFSNQISNFNKWKIRPCPWIRNPVVLQYLLTTPNFSERDMCLFSFRNEPPETSSEREQQRRLLS